MTMYPGRSRCITGWMSPPVNDAAINSVGVAAVTQMQQPRGNISGSGPVYLLKDDGQEALLAARYRLASYNVEIAERPFRSGNQDYPAGSWILAQQDGLPDALGKITTELALDFQSAAAAPDVARHPAPPPRLGIWVPWADTDMIGWTRFTLDQEKIPYTYVRDEDIRTGAFRNTGGCPGFRNRATGSSGANPRNQADSWPDAVQENSGISEPRDSCGIGGYYRRHRLGRIGSIAAIRGKRRYLYDSRRRIHPCAGKRHGARCTESKTRRRLHSRNRIACHFYPTGSSGIVRLYSNAFRIPLKFYNLRSSQAMVNHVLLHVLPRWTLGFPQCCNAMGDALPYEEEENHQRPSSLAVAARKSSNWKEGLLSWTCPPEKDASLYITSTRCTET